MTVEGSLRGLVVWDAGVDYHVLPFTVLEELEYSETVFDSIIDNEVLQQLWSGTQDQETAE